MKSLLPHPPARYCTATFLLAAAFFTLSLARAEAEVGDEWTRAYQPSPWGEALIKSVSYQNQMWVATVSGDSSMTHRLWASGNGTSWTLIKRSIPLDIQLKYDLVVFQDKLWAVGVSHPKWTAMSDPNWVISSLYGKTWTVAATKVPWNDGNLGSTVVFNNKLFVVNVATSTSVGAVYSSGDGSRWSLETASLPWGSLLKPAIVVFAGKIWVLGGADQCNGFDEIPEDPYPFGTDNWCSADGKVWTKVSPPPAWHSRYGITACVHEDKLWMMCGEYVEEIKWEYYPYYQWVDIGCADAWWSYDGIQWIEAKGPNIGNFLYFAGACDYQALSFDHKLWFVNYLLYTWAPPGVPVIKPLPDQAITEKDAYTSPFPKLNQGTRPVTWSLVNPTGGMAVNPVTGLVTWPASRAAGSPYRIRLHAVNGLGSDETSWTLTVNPQPPPKLSVPAFSKGGTVTVSWTSVPNISGYNIQRTETPDFANPLESANVSSTTLQRGFGGLTDGKTYWYRVRGKKIGDLTSAWSDPVACTQDDTAPSVSMTQNNSASDWPMLGAARVLLSASDPGSKPSGLNQMRFSSDGGRWTAWQPFRSTASVWVGHTGNALVQAQVSDQVGNVMDLATTVTVAERKALFVDCHNTSGPWLGTLEYPYNKIQTALSNSQENDLIVVAPGTYKEHVSFPGNNVVLRSCDPLCAEVVKSTVIDAQTGPSGCAVSLQGTESFATVLAGFSIINGEATQKLDEWLGESPTDDFLYRYCEGGGIAGRGCHASILNNRIMNNYAQCYYEDYSQWPDFSYTYYYGRGGGVRELRNQDFATPWNNQTVIG